MTTQAPAPNSDPQLSVIIPMYREAARIPQTLRDTIKTLSARKTNSELILIDDGSPDDTIEKVSPHLTTIPQGSLTQVRLIKHRINKGKGAAVRTGLAAATGQWHLIMDADNATKVSEVEKLLIHTAPGVGLIAGSRSTPDAEVDAVATRKITGLIFRIALKLLGLHLINDTQCGFKLYRSDLANQVANIAAEDGYAFDIEHLLITQATGLDTKEVGIRWQHQDGGQVSPIKDGLKMLRRAINIRAKRNAIRQSTQKLPATLPTSPTTTTEPPLILTTTKTPAKIH